MNIIHWLYERLAGQPYITTRSMADEFGPTLASRFPELGAYTDIELLRADIEQLVKHIERMRRRTPDTAAAMERVLAGVLSGAELTEVNQ